MPIPTYDFFIEPTLRFLFTNPEGARAGEVHEAVANALGLTEEQRAEVISSGQPVYKNRAGWAHDRLKRAGLSSSVKRGYWQLTESGREFAQSHQDPFTQVDREKLAMSFLSIRLKPAVDVVPLEEQALEPEPASSATVSPDDRLEQALRELRAATAAEVFESLMQVSPGYFEVIVLDVLHKLGYGANRTDLQRVGGTGDGGIDGVISLDKLGLEKVYVQAKRWQGSIGRPELQAFYGALAGQNAKKGVFITTSSFTSHAVAFGRSVQGIVLVDGALLVELMIDNEIGVSSRLLKVPKLDTDYFDEEA